MVLKPIICACDDCWIKPLTHMEKWLTPIGNLRDVLLVADLEGKGCYDRTYAPSVLALAASRKARARTRFAQLKSECQSRTCGREGFLPHMAFFRLTWYFWLGGAFCYGNRTLWKLQCRNCR